MTNIALGILLALNEHKEIRGTEELTRILGSGHKEYVIANALLLAKNGMINMEISTGGRGNKTIYRDAGVIKVNAHGHRN